jgi:N6-adenosine-specific RNA methylase IME4
VTAASTVDFALEADCPDPEPFFEPKDGPRQGGTNLPSEQSVEAILLADHLTPVRNASRSALCCSVPNMPATYDAARTALATLVRLDEVKDFRDKAMALAVYGRQAKDPELIAQATEVRLRAERRLGEIMEEMREAGELAVGTRGQLVGPGIIGGGADAPPIPTLADQGIDKSLAKRARVAAAMLEKEFEKKIAKTVAVAVASTEGTKEVIAAARAEAHEQKKEQRTAKEQALAHRIAALPQARFGVIYADPEWQFEFWSEKGKTNASADNHYPTTPFGEIKARPVPSISAEDSVLFLWTTVPVLPQALEVMAAWGFLYKSNFAWVKNRHGTGYWNWNKHELLLIGTRGKIPAPAPGEQWDSAIEADVGRHSEKPEILTAWYSRIVTTKSGSGGPSSLP